MAYLAEVDTGGKENDEPGLTMRGHLSNGARGVQGLPRRYGANLSYHILGASNAEIPMTQINTYLAIGFFKKFQRAAYKPKNVITDDIVARFIEDNHFRAKDVFVDVVKDCTDLVLTDIDPKELSKQPCCQLGHLPRVWAQGVNSWYSNSRGQRTRNATALNRELVDFSYENNNDQSLIGRLFRKLYKMSMDINYGPYYVAALLNNNGQDLLAAIDGQITEAENNTESQRIQIPDAEMNVVSWNQILIDKRGNKKAYQNFAGSVMDLAGYCDAMEQCIKTKEVLEVFRGQIKELYTGYFKPLCDMLDNLRESFEENEAYLKTPAAKKPNAYTWQILSLDDVKDRLDAAVKELDEKMLLSRFIENLLCNSEAWRLGDQDQIALLIRNYLLTLFENESRRGLKGYLVDRFPDAKGDAALLTDAVKDNIIKVVDEKAVPMFWCDPTYNLNSKDFTFSTSSLSVPNICSEVCNAAKDYVEGSTNKYTVRKTGIKDRIFALRFVSGIPLFAYHGIIKLKDAYDGTDGKASGAGVHLYAKTDRGTDGSGKKNWRYFLPTPMPYSKVKDVDQNMVPEGKKLVELYRSADKLGIIGTVPETDNNDFAIFVTPALEVKDYTIADFMDGTEFSKSIYDNVHNDLVKTFTEMHKLGVNPKCTKVDLKNDGNADLCDMEEVRMDYFIHYPKLQELVREEIDKYNRLKAAIEHIQQLKDEYEKYDGDISGFSKLLFFRQIDILNGEGNADYVKTSTVSFKYQNQYNEERSFILCRSGMKFEKYPLYQAFRTYRWLETVSEENPENLDLSSHTKKDLRNLRKNLDAQAIEYQKKPRVETDYVVPAILKKLWSTDALYELEHEGLKGMGDADRNAIVRFYKNLRKQVDDVEARASSWPRNKTVEELSQMLNPVTFAWIWYNGQQLELYPAMYRNYAFDRAANNWVPLNNQMYIAKNGQWVPIQMDPLGNIIL
jgi:hypothetical protein